MQSFIALNALLQKYPTIRDLLLVVLFAASAYQSNQTNELVVNTSVQYEYKMMQFAMKDLDAPNEAVTLVRQWQDDKWGAQIAAIQVLCERGYDKLTGLVGTDSASSMCRIVQ